MNISGLNLPVIVTPGNDHNSEGPYKKLRTPSPRPELPDINKKTSNGSDDVARDGNGKKSDSDEAKYGHKTDTSTRLAEVSQLIR